VTDVIGQLAMASVIISQVFNFGWLFML